MDRPQIVVQLIHIQGGLKGEIQEFHQDELTIGRLPSCSVTFPADEPGVSREHAKIQREGNQFRLTDLSRYGTLVNGKQVKTAYLRSGDVIEFGPGGPKASITMEVAASPNATPASPPAVAAEAASAGKVPRPAEVVPAAAEPPVPAYVPVQPAPRATASVPTPPPVHSIPKAMAPLVIQFGPTIRTYRELPVVIGTHGSADFQLRHPGILDQHAQIFFQADAYWIRDLTGKGLLKVNLREAGEVPVRLNQHDEILCSPHGPTFRFLGDGRLAEVEPVDEFEESAEASHKLQQSPAKPDSGSFLNNLMKGWKRP